jgi:tRNA pseudouridine55 synthase
VDGLLLIDKPKGWTSFDVVAKVRGIVKSQTGLKRPKVGHTGTLDPLATGLLVLTIGKYCKRAQEFSKLDKVYEVEIKLGEISTTGDGEGNKTKISSQIPSEKQLTQVTEQFIGKIEQTPPIYSAIKVGGKRAYQLAREGKEVKLQPRTVKINSITKLSYEYPFVRFTASVSSGTYIRSLAEDIGKALKTGAYMSSLRRSHVGDFKLAEAHLLKNLPADIAKTLTLC